MAPSCAEDHDLCEVIYIYRDSIREDVMEFGDTLASLSFVAQQELNVAEIFAVYNA